MEPMEIVLRPGQSVKVTLHETDGEFLISFGGIESNVLSIEADMPDSSGRKGTLYREEWDTEEVGERQHGISEYGKDVLLSRNAEKPAKTEAKPKAIVCSKHPECLKIAGHGGPCRSASQIL